MTRVRGCYCRHPLTIQHGPAFHPQSFPIDSPRPFTTDPTSSTHTYRLSNDMLPAHPPQPFPIDSPRPFPSRPACSTRRPIPSPSKHRLPRHNWSSILSRSHSQQAWIPPHQSGVDNYSGEYSSIDIALQLEGLTCLIESLPSPSRPSRSSSVKLIGVCGCSRRRPLLNRHDNGCLRVSLKTPLAHPGVR